MIWPPWRDRRDARPLFSIIIPAFNSAGKLETTIQSVLREPADMWDKVPQAVNLNTWSATLFIGRDGRVKATYSGFASAASGVYNKELKDDFTSIVDRLLAGRDVPTSAIQHGADVASR